MSNILDDERIDERQLVDASGCWWILGEAVLHYDMDGFVLRAVLKDMTNTGNRCNCKEKIQKSNRLHHLINLQ